MRTDYYQCRIHGEVVSKQQLSETISTGQSVKRFQGANQQLTSRTTSVRKVLKIVDRRNFLRSLIGGVATAAAVRTFPFRVFSFPTEIVVPEATLLSVSEIVSLELEGVAHLIPTLLENDQMLFEQIGAMRYFQNSDHLTGKFRNLVRVSSQQARGNART